MNDTDQENHAEAQRYFHLRLQAVRNALNDSDKQDALMQDCLALEARIAVDIQLSTGGPGDGFEIICDAATGQPLHGSHYFVCWGYCKKVLLSQDELSDVCAAYGLDDAMAFLNQRR